MSDQLVKTDLAVGILLLLEVPAWGHGALQDPAERRALPVLICSLNRNVLGRENGSPSLFGLEPVSLYVAWWEIQWSRKGYVAVSRMLWLMGVRNEALSFSVAVCRSLHIKSIKLTVVAFCFTNHEAWPSVPGTLHPSSISWCRARGAWCPQSHCAAQSQRSSRLWCVVAIWLLSLDRDWISSWKPCQGKEPAFWCELIPE